MVVSYTFFTYKWHRNGDNHMIYYLVGSLYLKELTFISVLFAFALTILAIHFGEKTLPRDAGRAFAINGTKSVGKPRGAGIIFRSEERRVGKECL